MYIIGSGTSTSNLLPNLLSESIVPSSVVMIVESRNIILQV